MEDCAARQKTVNRFATELQQQQKGNGNSICGSACGGAFADDDADGRKQLWQKFNERIMVGSIGKDAAEKKLIPPFQMSSGCESRQER